MRVICMVPSLTESLLECGVQVVGRTRFCVHPAEVVADIPVVGGTKDIDWQKVAALKADLLILDGEENPRRFADESPLRWVATHVRSVGDLSRDLLVLSEACANAELRSWSERAARLLSHARSGRDRSASLPGVQIELSSIQPGDEVVYVIWKNPWMAASANTYIGSVLQLLGFQVKELPAGDYPVISEQDFGSSYVFFSSEPFPFAQKHEELRAAGWKGAIVDGECYSWFGVRGIRFLESALSSHH